MRIGDKISKIKEDGLNSLVIISDFDGTLTRGYSPQGVRESNSSNVLSKKKILGDKYTNIASALERFYLKVENEPTLSIEKRTAYMNRWWTKQWEAMAASGLKRSHIKEVIAKKHITERKHFNDFFDIIYAHNVPLIILSAGIEDIIEQLIKNQGRLTNNVHVVSNRLKFDNKGEFTGENEFGVMITSMNKTSIHIKNRDFYPIIKDRKNAVLIGDSISDANMDNGMNYDTVLKIGFFRDDGNEKKKIAYQNAFDILLDDSQDLLDVIHYINAIFN